MNRKFCKCGKPIFHNNLCADHWNDKNPLVTLPKKVEIIMCPKCGLIKDKGKWVKYEPEKFFKNLAKKNGEVNYWTIEPYNNSIKVIVGGWINGKRTKMEKKISVHFNKQICETDGKLQSGYYEAKIQLRGDVSGDVIQTVDREFNRLSKHDKKSFFRHEVVKDGVDIFAGNKQSARKVTNMLEEKFKVKVKKSFKLVTHKEGKPLTRETYSVRIESE